MKGYEELLEESMNHLGLVHISHSTTCFGMMMTHGVDISQKRESECMDFILNL